MILTMTSSPRIAENTQKQEVPYFEITSFSGETEIFSYTDIRYLRIQIAQKNNTISHFIILMEDDTIIQDRDDQKFVLRFEPIPLHYMKMDDTNPYDSNNRYNILQDLCDSVHMHLHVADIYALVWIEKNIKRDNDRTFMIRDLLKRIIFTGHHHLFHYFLMDTRNDIEERDNQQPLTLYREDVNNFSIHGRRPLHISASMGHFKAVECLINLSADLCYDYCESGIDAINAAARNGFETIVTYLIQLRAPIHQDERIHECFVHCAAQNKLSMVKCFLNEGLNVNCIDTEQKDTALICAATNGRQELVEYLITMGANVNFANARNETAITRATREGHNAVAECLIKGGADINHLDVPQPHLFNH